MTMDLSDPTAVEDYSASGEVLNRELRIGGIPYVSTATDISSLPEETPLWSRWWKTYLRGGSASYRGRVSGGLSIVDMFCGCGGFSLGVVEAARALGLRAVIKLAVDIDDAALSVFRANHDTERTLHANVGGLVDFQLRNRGKEADFVYPPVPIHKDLENLRGKIDIMLAGPPCQGYSNLNNRTRRSDPRNLLYLEAVACAIAVGARAVIVENVPDVVNDRSEIVDTSIAVLRRSGYHITSAVLAANDLGFAQSRRRFFLAASRQQVLDLEALSRSLQKPATTVRWALEDIVDSSSDQILDASPVLSADNRLRIDYLFDHDLYELPDKERPDCHRNGHTYPSVYGRLRWDSAAGTITTGYMTPGRGRFVHPSRRRTLTPREAARLQGFPDSFKFHSEDVTRPTKNDLAKWIGDAVPPILGYVSALAVVPGFISGTQNVIEAQKESRGR